MPRGRTPDFLDASKAFSIVTGRTREAIEMVHCYARTEQKVQKD